MNQLQETQETVTKAEYALTNAKEKFEGVKVKNAIQIGKKILEKSKIIENELIMKSIMGFGELEELQAFYIAKDSQDYSIKYLIFVDIYGEEFVVLDDRFINEDEIDYFDYNCLSTCFIAYGLEEIGVDLEEAGLEDTNIIEVFDNEIKDFLSTVASEYLPIITTNSVRYF